MVVILKEVVREVKELMVVILKVKLK